MVRACIVALTGLVVLALGACAPCRQLATCDIDQSDCQQQIHDIVSCARGVSGDLPAIEVVDADEFIADKVAEAERDDQTEADPWRIGLSFFDLAPSSDTAAAETTDYWERIGGF